MCAKWHFANFDTFRNLTFFYINARSFWPHLGFVVWLLLWFRPRFAFEVWFLFWLWLQLGFSLGFSFWFRLQLSSQRYGGGSSLSPKPPFDRRSARFLAKAEARRPAVWGKEKAKYYCIVNHLFDFFWFSPPLSTHSHAAFGTYNILFLRTLFFYFVQNSVPHGTIICLSSLNCRSPSSQPSQDPGWARRTEVEGSSPTLLGARVEVKINRTEVKINRKIKERNQNWSQNLRCDAREACKI